jgi:hypothetical protein
MGGGHPIRKIAIPLTITNRPMIAALFLIEHSSSDPYIPCLELMIYYKKRSQKRKEKCLDFC